MREGTRGKFARALLMAAPIPGLVGSGPDGRARRNRHEAPSHAIELRSGMTACGIHQGNAHTPTRRRTHIRVKADAPHHLCGAGLADCHHASGERTLLFNSNFTIKSDLLVILVGSYIYIGDRRACDIQAFCSRYSVFIDCDFGFVASLVQGCDLELIGCALSGAPVILKNRREVAIGAVLSSLNVASDSNRNGGLCGPRGPKGGFGCPREGS
ncbi:hypothetical protein LMG29542_07138 [Paraburkholderia humisilvae]|uniref:Uncharacterized protein n=1 Tax=Paraburkholderia humisilvae TaxID=627669 RepID=A0A6J5F346_9BURK|nr:hypothetical protein LMG29542_07138 [Paraburkholderia humisilvae]